MHISTYIEITAMIFYNVFYYVACLVVTHSMLYECFSPFVKRRLSSWRLECELGVISDPDCPVDGAWSSWGSWSICHGRCDGIGHRQRTRECNNPAPSNDGIPCSGPSEQIEPCHLTNCTVSDYRKLVQGDSARLDALRQLEAVPALLERCLQTECSYDAIDTALVADNTWNLNPESLWNALLCVKYNLGCPVIGEWGVWGEWSACGARCGRGLRWRLRRCDTPSPSDAQFACSGTPLQAQQCEGDQCALFVRSSGIDATRIWSEWGKWTTCSEKCGPGVMRRRRTCKEKYIAQTGSWGTHCRGQHDQLEVCANTVCFMDGGWSGWGAWGPCSQSCGSGRRSRTRSCTRPIPSGGGANCAGLRSEVGSCYVSPCKVYLHTVAVFNGDSYMHYNFENKYSTLFHFYVRFLPLSPHGTLVRRGEMRNPRVRLSLQKQHVCLDASGVSNYCILPRMCSHSSIELAVWHTAMITVSTDGATLRLDDAQVPIRAAFPCDPDLNYEKMNIIIGAKLHGEIQELILNFIPLDMLIEREQRIRRTDFVPYSASDIAYVNADRKEAYLNFDNDQYLRIPCFNSDQDEWTLELTLKSKREAGTILFLWNNEINIWLHVNLLNTRIKLKLALDDYRSETSSSTEVLPDQWLDLTLTKKSQTNTVEALINAGERLHVLLAEEGQISRRNFDHAHHLKHSHEKKYVNDSIKDTLQLVICTDEFYVGGIPEGVKTSELEEFTPFSGVIAALSINNVLQDLNSFNAERNKDGELQVSSRTASVSGSYHEVSWGMSNRLNLTCLHARTARTPNYAHWLYLDTVVSIPFKGKDVRSADSGRVLRLIATAYDDLKGFFTCRAHSNKVTRNVITYGVVGQVQHKLTGPDTTTTIAVITTLTLVIATFVWLIIEGVNDLKNGYGFYRDGHFSPEEEAESVCRYIDKNVHLIGSKSAAKMAKCRARRKAELLASQMSVESEETEEPVVEAKNDYPVTSDTLSEPSALPALPEVQSSSMEPLHKVYRCDPSYVSSPLHGSNITSARAKLTSSSSFELTSPRTLYSRLLLAKRIHSSRESMLSRKSKSTSSGHFRVPRKVHAKLMTIKSSTIVNLSPAQKILQKFHELKTED